MVKTTRCLLCLILLFSAIAPTFAAGDKVRGEKGQGAVNQVDFDSQDNQF